MLRFTVHETGGTAAGNVDNQFQCSLNGGTFQNITTSSTIAKAVAAAAFANAENTTKRLSGTGTFESSSQGCTEDGLSGGAQNDIAASGNSETECAIQINDADTNPGDVITFQLTSPDFTITNDVVPTVTLANPLVVTPATASLTTTTFAPTVSVSNNVAVTPGVLALTVSTFAPTVTVGTILTPAQASLIVSTFAPTVTISDNKAVTPGTLTLTLTTFAPTVNIGIVITPSTAVFILTTFAPTVSASTHLCRGLAVSSGCIGVA